MAKPSDAEYADALYRTHFDAFAQRAFNVIEPATKYDWSWHVGAIAEHLEAVFRGEIPRLIINLPPRSLKSYLVATAFPAWVLGKAPHTKFIVTSYGFEVVEANARRCKQIIMSDWYQQLFPGTRISHLLDRITNFETTQAGQYYAASALSPITGLGCDYMVCDDLIRPMEAYSDTVRNSTNANLRATLLNRFNDRRTGKFIMVMQRLHDDDPTGHLLRDGGYHVLKLPAETKVPVTISLGDKKWEMAADSLLFPERLSRETLDRIRLDMSEFNYCTPAESPVLMGDLTTKAISDIVAGDMVMGFTLNDVHENGKIKRRRLTTSIVQRIICHQAQVIKLTLDSGRTVRCTEDHKWFTGRGNRSRNERARKLYLPAKIGRVLCKVCEPELPALKTEQDFRMAGWLAGFFDGEGSAVVNKGNANRGVTITFTQGADRNLPLCQKLEEALRYFGFDFSYGERIREDRKYKTVTSPLTRYYWLNGNSLENNRKLLHLIKVNKWRDRLVQGSYISRFVRAEERIVSIEQDGVEPVYSLTTETGNYVVWGYASSNCGQYLQSPVPMGGGEFKDEWIQYYKAGSVKPKEMNICILVDQAGGEELNRKKRKLSDWTVIQVWGLASDNNYYLLDMIRDRLNPTDRIENIFMMVRKWNSLTGKPPRVGCEQIGLMTDTHYLKEKQRQDAYHFPVIPLGAGQKISKEERIRKLIPIMQQRRMYVPESLIYVDSEGRRWDLIREFVDVELATFPKSRYDDVIDCASRILDTELAMNFPALKIGTVAKARRAASQQPDSWESY